jgi:hypothetical protein
VPLTCFFAGTDDFVSSLRGGDDVGFAIIVSKEWLKDAGLANVIGGSGMYGFG